MMFTKGPWKMRQSPDNVAGYQCTISVPAKGWSQAIADVVALADAKQADANARLIATAPELYEALKEAVRLYEGYGLLAQDYDCGKWVNVARVALAKADGGK